MPSAAREQTSAWSSPSWRSRSLALGLHACRYMPFICDDALISLRYAKRLLEGQGLTWNPGERVEGVLEPALGAEHGRPRLAGRRSDRERPDPGRRRYGATLAAVCYAFPPSSLSAAPVTGIALLFLALLERLRRVGDRRHGATPRRGTARVGDGPVLPRPRIPHVSFRQMQGRACAWRSSA